LIILTNDGEFTNKVASSRTFAKVYEVKVKGLPNENAINKLRRGIRLEDGFKTAPAEIKELKHTENNGWYEVTLYEGHNQQIRKMFDAIGHSVVKLRRISIGHVKDERIPVGAYRELDEDEVKEFFNPKPKKTKTSASTEKSSMQNRRTDSGKNRTESKKPRSTKKR
jgi:23S rRNA pseudouridine2605 synthase